MVIILVVLWILMFYFGYVCYMDGKVYNYVDRFDLVIYFGVNYIKNICVYK